jgi:ABC-2 type transport system ATP-binding protein
MTLMIQVQELRKEFGDLVAVNGVSFEARAGEIFGLLGPNGAGKSTTLNCICGLLPPTAGRVRVMGHDVVSDGKAARAALGVAPQEIALYQELSAAENLAYWGGAQGLRGANLKRRSAKILETVGLADRAKDLVKTYSGGMKRRLNFAASVIHDPKVVLLDEPTVGVDPQSRFHLLDLVRAQAAAGNTVLYTTHYMEEAEQLCDRLAIIDGGRVIAAGTMDELRAMIGERDLLRLTGAFDGPKTAVALARLDAVEVVQSDPQQITLALPRASSRLPEVFGAIAQAGGEIRDTTLTRPSLETLFLKLTGKELRE